MPLNPTQIALIDKHLRSDNWLLNRVLIAELTDHYQEAIAMYMAESKTFDEALRAVHTDFGGRKGLLAMEENFELARHKDARRLLSDKLKSYLRWPRLLFTLVVISSVAYLACSPVATYFFDYVPFYARAAAVGHFAILLLVQGYKLIRKRPTLLNRYNFFALYSGYGIIIYAGMWPHLIFDRFETGNFANHHPILSSLTVIAVILYEAAVIDYLDALAQRTARLKTASRA
ncbi:hypothetical protein J2I47_15520 [Fibrella sp. HMF5335]|uniref:Uncharacterized protein n=1 Tax=Fibrella rubiginis TaxID=2817060 RepID=A0A939GJK0_9BACT|nr:hypothetical protein [Fibrella rubiginis]MBO0937965.1 hypothetical protein [Fibrella rubiginis]